MSKNIPIKEIPLALRPREKFKKYGASFLENHELLAILLGSGIEGKNVAEISKSILKKHSKNIADLDYKEIAKVYCPHLSRQLSHFSSLIQKKSHYATFSPLLLIPSR